MVLKWVYMRRNLFGKRSEIDDSSKQLDELNLSRLEFDFLPFMNASVRPTGDGRLLPINGRSFTHSGPSWPVGDAFFKMDHQVQGHGR